MSAYETFIPPSPLNTAVLFLVFNRPDVTAQVFDSIRKAKPPRLYVAADGPRSGREGEAQRCSEVRRIATAVDWPCEVQTLFREQNLGCKRAVSEGISWFFKHEEQGIILEDDCLPNQSFFWFCEAMLARFNEDESIMAVTGTNITEGIKFEADYFFSNYALMWGWATWARAWRKCDLELDHWPSKDQLKHLKKLGMSSLHDRVLWRRSLNSTFNGSINTWDYQWIYSCWLSNGLTVAPAKNLIRNIGFSREATHTTSKNHPLSNLKTEVLHWPLNDLLGRNTHAAADAFISKYWFGADWKSTIKYLILRLPLASKLNTIRRKYIDRNY